jgi:hypothetical protein
VARDRADSLDPVGLAAPMLELVASLDPNGIPEAVLTSPPARAYLRSRRGAPSTAAAVDQAETPPEAARRAVRNLYRLSLVNHDPDDAYRSVRMHALAQRATLDELDRAADAIRAAADALVAAWPDIETDTSLGQVLRANGAVLAERSPTALWEPDAHAVLFRIGRSLGEAGLVTGAVNHFAAMASIAPRILGADHPDTLTTRNNLAHWRRLAVAASDKPGESGASEVS